MKRYIYKYLNIKAIRQAVSFLLVLLICFGSFPLADFKNSSDKPNGFTSVSAAGTYNYSDPPSGYRFAHGNDNTITIDLKDFAEYSKSYQQYPEYHKNDIIKIRTAGTENNVPFLQNFCSLGFTGHPFAGSLSFMDMNFDSIVLDVPLFEEVLDTVPIKVPTNGGNQFVIERFNNDYSPSNNEKTPLLANKVVGGTGTKAVWNIKVQRYTGNQDQAHIDSFAGFIGTIAKSSEGTNAKVTLNATLDFTSSSNRSIAMESKSGDIGAACGTIEDSCELDFSLTVTGGSSGGAVTAVSTDSGNAGGFVGNMGDGAEFKLTLLSGGLFGSATEIKTTASGADTGFAGGIVGRNKCGKVTMPSGTKYTVNQIISGTSGAGGVYGYYEPDTSTDSITPNATYTINCKLNGTGNDGAIFGELVSGHNFTITDNTTDVITSDHQSGSAGSYGGIIGKYSTGIETPADSLEVALTITNIKTAMSRSGAATNYGGGIGIVDGDAYVKLNSLTVNSATGAEADKSTFGGAVASALKGYIDVDGISFGASTNYHGGGVVGALGNGVLRLTGTIDLSNAKPTSGGQVVGTRDNALVYADNWTFSRSGNGYDNIGSWGDVLVFGSGLLTKSNVLTEDNSAHTISIVAPESTISSADTFATTSLGLQIDYSANNIIITGTQVNDTDNLTFSGTVNLTGTGLKGLTRDNTDTDSLTAAHCVFSGTINGGGATVTLDIQNVGVVNGVNGSRMPIHRHIYNGLIGISNGATVNNLTLDGTVNVNAQTAMYAGAVAARATGNFTAKGISCSTVFTANGSKTIYLGRMLGEASTGIGAITIEKYTNSTANAVTNNSFTGNVTSSNSDAGSCLGGVIGKISHATNEAKTWSISDVTLSGKLKNTSAKSVQRIGGLIAEIVPYSNENPNTPSSYNSRQLTLKNISTSMSVEGALNVNEGVALSSGGLLGYSWLSTDVDIGEIKSATVNGNTTYTAENGITVTNGAVKCDSSKADCGDTAGLVYQATGKWTVNHVAISGITLTGNATNGIRSFGVLVNKGWYSSGDYYTAKDRQALYLVLPQYHTYTISGDNFDSVTITDFDELLTYSAYYSQSAAATRTYSDRGSDDGAVSDIMVNGQAIVSYNNGNTTFGGLKMESTAENSKTYVAKTTRGQTINPYSRYYYNLDTIPSGPTDPVKLMKWGLHIYSCANLKKHFTDPFTGTWSSTGLYTGTISGGNYDMKTYSWYPVNVDGSVTVNGTFKLYNKEFEACEATYADTKPKMSSLTEGANASQHYMLHNGLIHNVTGMLKTGNIILQGNVGATSRGSGALVCGIVKGDTTSTAKLEPVSSTSAISLDGVYIHNRLTYSSYAPLLINRSGSYTAVKVHGVSTTGQYDTDNNYTAATSLVGYAGNNDTASINVNIEFSDIRLDGRSSSGSPVIIQNVYNTTHSIFTLSTLLHSFKWASGSKGTYNYAYSVDWDGSGNHLGHVTYGSEISDNTERNQYFGEEFWYSGEDHDSTSARITDYNSSSHIGKAPIANAPVSFTGFLPYVYEASTKANVKTEKKYQLEINHALATFSGCGTYNHPYSVVDGAFETVATILNGTGFPDGTSIRLPTLLDGNGNEVWTPSTLKSTKWDENGCKEYKFHNNRFVQFTKNGDTITYDDAKGYALDDVREYLAGAYFVLNDNITIGDTFIGLGSVSGATDNAYVFRGIIDGRGYTITNESENPLIMSSYGSVVRNLKIVVDSNISKSKGNADPLSINVTEGFYGAVMGQIFGGDNIIDDVTVQFSEGVHITLSGDKKQLIPVGGYVGVVVNGGLIFRGMEKTGAGETYRRGTVDIQGIPSDSTIVISGLETNLVSETNTKWLYVNPIVGRVLNGYAITEATKYRPFEDGTRTYPNGDKEYWKDGTVDTATKAQLEADEDLDSTMKSSAAPVTMRNGNKNYSITDISTDKTLEPDFTVTAPSGGHPGNEYSTVTVSNAQSLFIISLITESGLGTSANGKYDDTNNILKPYTDYMATHLAEYNYVGNDNLPSSKPTAIIPNAVSDIDKGSNDFYVSTGDVVNDSSYNDTKIPYLIKNYTPYGDTAIPYPAFNLAAFEGGKNELYLKLTFDSSGDSIYHIPDGFRGLGALLLQNGIDTDWANTATDRSPDTRVFNAMCLSELNGNNRIVSLNMRLLLYSNDNYLTPNRAQACLKTGYGFFNALRSTGGTSTSNKIKDLTIKGSVYYDLFKNNGQHITYDQNGLNQNARPATGAFIGAPGVDTNTDGGGGDMWLENIKLDNVTVTGVDSVGGFMGCSNAEKKYSFYECSAENLEVVGGTSVGGMIGYVRNGSSVIDADFNGNEFGIISIRGRSSWVGGGNNHGDSAVGGLFGDNYANNNTGITVKNVTIRNASSVSKGYVGYDPDYKNSNIPSAGGVFGGAFRSSAMTLTGVTVSNIDVKGAKSGGMIGSIVGSYKTTISDSSVTTTNGCVIESTYTDNTPTDDKDNKASSGGFIGTNNLKLTVEISDSQLYGYTIVGFDNVGGIIGFFGASSSGATYTTSLKNIELSGHTLKGYKDVGGLVGSLTTSYDREILGYNIRINDQTMESYTSGGSKTNHGYIVGNNGGGESSDYIKIAGFSRQGTIDTELMVGKPQSGPYVYGTGGYVIFADYNDTASTEHNPKPSNLIISEDDVIELMAVGSRTVVTDYTIITQKDSYGSSIVQDVTSLITSDTTSASVVGGLNFGEQNVIVSGNKLGYEPEVASSDLQQVNTAAELTATGNDGFYLYCVTTKRYLAQDLSIAASQSFDGAAKMYIEILDSENSYYGIYTYINGIKKYLSVDINNSAGEFCAFYTSEEADTLIATHTGRTWDHYFTITENFHAAKQFEFVLTSNSGTGTTRKHFRTNGSGRFCFAETSAKALTIWQDPPLPSDIFVAKSYSATSFDPVEGESISGTLTSGGTGTAGQLETILSDAGYDSTDTSYEAFVVTKTVVENIYEYENNHSPYVTTSPKTVITKSGNTPVQWLTGDGLSKETFKDINNERTDTTVKKRYQSANTVIDGYDTSKIISGFSTSKSEFDSSYTGEDFHMLVLEDTTPSVTTALVNNYLRLLTNTNYNFSDTIYNNIAGNENGEKDIPFKVVRKKFVYQNGSFVGNDTNPTFRWTNTEGFYMVATDVDSAAADPQFTLLDVQFFDPSDTSTSNRKIAYHLYVPVYTRKVVQFLFSAGIASGSDYFTSPYINQQMLFENLGTPVTLRLDYSYCSQTTRTAQEWISAINGGESVMGNYYKSITLKNETGTWKNGTKFVLVDSSSNGKVYYNSTLTMSSPSPNDELSIDFSSFTDDQTIPYVPVPLYKLINPTIALDNENGSLYELIAGDDIGTATVYADGKYYKPMPAADYSYNVPNSNTVIKQSNYSALTNKYTVTGVSPITETYYLSIFTPKATEAVADNPDTPEDETVAGEVCHHFSFTSPDKLTAKTIPDSSSTPMPNSKLKGQSEKLDLYTGNLFVNEFTYLTVYSGENNYKMSESNNIIHVNMQAKIRLTEDAITAGVDKNLASAANAGIYQTFQMAYSMTDQNNDTKVGIQVPYPDVNFTYSINDGTTNNGAANRNHNYIEFPNGQNLKGYLTTGTKEAVIDITAVIEHDSGSLSAQFPPKSDPSDTTIGTNVIAFSRIASSTEAVSHSSTMIKRTDSGQYYTDTSASASMKYNLDFVNSVKDPAGTYNELGINAFGRTSEDSTSVIHTEARYDTHTLNNTDDFIQLTLKLTRRSVSDTGTGGYDSTALPLEYYIKSIKIYGAEGIYNTTGKQDLLTLAETHQSDIKFTSSPGTDPTEYILMVKKELLETDGDRVYIFPIDLEIYTGNIRLNSTNGLYYSNYKVTLTAGMYGSLNGTEVFAPSQVSDYLIYTNARMDTSWR